MVVVVVAVAVLVEVVVTGAADCHCNSYFCHFFSSCCFLAVVRPGGWMEHAIVIIIVAEFMCVTCFMCCWDASLWPACQIPLNPPCSDLWQVAVCAEWSTFRQTCITQKCSSNIFCWIAIGSVSMTVYWEYHYLFFFFQFFHIFVYGWFERIWVDVFHMDRPHWRRYCCYWLSNCSPSHPPFWCFTCWQYSEVPMFFKVFNILKKEHIL